MRIRIQSLKVALTFVFVLLIVVEKIGFRNFLETLDQFENHKHNDSIIVKALNDFSSGGVTTTAKLVESKNHPRPKVEYDLEDEEEDVRGRTTIPSCDNGCVLLFFHIPKTGRREREGANTGVDWQMVYSEFSLYTLVSS